MGKFPRNRRHLPDVTTALLLNVAAASCRRSFFVREPCGVCRRGVILAGFILTQRILRPGGLLYINVPSNGDFHRYPLDCWRFYPDAGVALVRWAGRRGIEIELVESFIGREAAKASRQASEEDGP